VIVAGANKMLKIVWVISVRRVAWDVNRVWYGMRKS